VPEGPDLVDYIKRGAALGARCNPLFDGGLYDRERRPAAGDVSALEHALRHPELAVHGDTRLDRPLDGVVDAFVRQAATRPAAFDPGFYRACYPEFADAPDAACERHFESAGQADGFHGSARGALRSLGLRIADLPIGFQPEDYVDLNPDLEGWRGRSLRLFVHYLDDGRRQERRIGAWQLRLAGLALLPPHEGAAAGSRPLALRTDLAVLAHVYYPELWPELAGFAANFQTASSDLFVNVAEGRWSPGLQRRLRELAPGAFVQVSANRGRDIGGHMRLLDGLDIGRYRVFALMHTKRSRRLSPEESAQWRQTLLAAFAGTRETAAECLHAFRDDPALGIVAAAGHRAWQMGRNRKLCELLFDRLGIEGENRRLDYCAGTMFLIRSEIVARLHEGLRGLDWADSTAMTEEDLFDGQLEHAVERVIPSLARQMGYRVDWR
jgi:hypothetical protein